VAPRRRPPRRAHRRPAGSPALRRAADALLLLSVGLLAPLSGGAVTARSTVVLDLSSGSWAAVAVPAGAAPTTGPLALPWSQRGSSADAIVDVVATGTLALSGFRLRLDADGPDPVTAVTVTACLGGTWEGPDCAGTTAPVGDLTGTSVLEVALDPAERIALRAETPRPVANRTTFVLRVEVARTDVRGAPEGGD